MNEDWTPIALSRDVPAGVTRAVRLDDRELVVWRGDGAAHVWEDRCPHRGMRLSLGFVRNNALNCLYHGWEYGAAASCVRIPAHPDLTVPPSIKANAFPAVEAGGLVWVGRHDAGTRPEPPEAVTPILSLGVDIDSLDAPRLDLDLPGGTLHLYWHRVTAGRIMLHAVSQGDVDPIHAAARVRHLRDELEQQVAA